MSLNFSEKRDLKALQVLSLYTHIESVNKEHNNSLKIGFITHFGIVRANSILKSGFEDESLNQSNYLKFMFQTSVTHSKELLREQNNEDVLKDQTAFILEDVTINSHDSIRKTNLPLMILFSQDIVGLCVLD